MALILTNEGEKLLLEWALKSTSTPEDLELRLFTNDYSPVATSVTADFTEATFTDYAAKELSRDDWTTPTTNIDGEAETTQEVQTWIAGSSQTIYGYYVVGASSGKTIWAERFTTARTPAISDELSVTPRFTLYSQF
jgi:hypothetical protein